MKVSASVYKINSSKVILKLQNYGTFLLLPIIKLDTASVVMQYYRNITQNCISVVTLIQYCILNNTLLKYTEVFI